MRVGLVEEVVARAAPRWTTRPPAAVISRTRRRCRPAGDQALESVVGRGRRRAGGVLQEQRAAAAQRHRAQPPQVAPRLGVEAADQPAGVEVRRLRLAGQLGAGAAARLRRSLRAARGRRARHARARPAGAGSGAARRRRSRTATTVCPRRANQSASRPLPVPRSTTVASRRHPRCAQLANALAPAAGPRRGGSGRVSFQPITWVRDAAHPAVEPAQPGHGSTGWNAGSGTRQLGPVEELQHLLGIGRGRELHALEGHRGGRGERLAGERAAAPAELVEDVARRGRHRTRRRAPCGRRAAAGTA